MTEYHGPYVADDDEARGLMSLVTGRELPAEPAGEEAVMGPGDADRIIAARMSAELADEAYMEAVRRAYAGKWDIIEVPYGFLAVPDGTPVVRASTLGALSGKLSRQPEPDHGGTGAPVTHAAEPRLDDTYTMDGPRAGRLFDLRYAGCWPAEGPCTRCGEMLRREAVTEPWEHTGRTPGEPLG